MPKRKDISGNKFGYLTAINFDHSDGKYTYWRCKCKCGNEVIRRMDKLTAHKTPSCGCYLQEINHADENKKKKESLLIVWRGMKERCADKNNKYYGAKGIKVCKAWSGKNGFETFYRWALKNGYEKGLTIERINVNANYSAINCKWIPMSEQAKNRSNTIWIDYKGEVIDVATFSEKTGIDRKKINEKIHQKRVYSGDYLLKNIRKNFDTPLC